MSIETEAFNLDYVHLFILVLPFVCVYLQKS